MGFPKQLQPILVPFGTVVAKPEYLRKKSPLHAIGDVHQGCDEVSSWSGRAAAAGWRFILFHKSHFFPSGHNQLPTGYTSVACQQS